MAGHRRELDAEEWGILAVLAQSEDLPEDRTSSRIAARIRCDPETVGALVKLEREGLVLSVSGNPGELIWISTTPEA